jgi:hypothetical protein
MGRQDLAAFFSRFKLFDRSGSSSIRPSSSIL